MKLLLILVFILSLSAAADVVPEREPQQQKNTAAKAHAALHYADTLDNPLHALPKTDKTWGDTLNPKGTIPESGFDAYYININHPTAVIARENVPHISLNYARPEAFHHIAPPELGAYWVGKINIPKDALYRISLGQTVAKTRILLDKHILLDVDGVRGNPNAQIPIALSAGEYLLEVEHINHMSDAQITLSVRPAVQELNDRTLRAAIDQLQLPPNTVVYAVGTHRSGNLDNSITLQAAANTPPYILLLSADTGILWEINDPAPEAVIYNNAALGGIVKSATPVPLIAWQGRFLHKHIKEKLISCQCNKENKPQCAPDPVIANIEKITGYPLAGISGSFRAQRLTIPDLIINEKMLNDPQTRQKRLAEQAEECKARIIKTPANLMETSAPEHSAENPNELRTKITPGLHLKR